MWPTTEQGSHRTSNSAFHNSTVFKDNADRQTTPRMPWHDIGAAFVGQTARDAARYRCIIEHDYWISVRNHETQGTKLLMKNIH